VRRTLTTSLVGVAIASATMDGGGPTLPPGDCSEQVEQQLRTWGAVAPARPQPPTDGGLVRHWPTAQIGVWLVELRGASGAEVMRVAPDVSQHVRWSHGCRPTAAQRARQPVASPSFTDADLRRTLAAGAAGIIYSWSPHMPLSLDGLEIVRGVAAARGLALTVVLDPGADRGAAASAAAARQWPGSTLRVADSVELTFRDLFVHAPAIQPYVAGRLVGSPWPGYHGAAEYTAFLDRVLAP
jgi:hypothetical protein